MNLIQLDWVDIVVMKTLIKYRRYVEYYHFIDNFKKHCVDIQSYELAIDVRGIEKKFFWNDDKLDIVAVSQWYFTPDIHFNEVEFNESLEILCKKHNILWLLRDLKLKVLFSKGELFNT